MTSYRDRGEAGLLLAQALSQWKGSRPLVLAIPRGAVPMGKAIADALGGELDVVLVRKLPAPGNPEFAIGAVAETGWSHVADHASSVGATPEYIEHAVAAERETMRKRRAQYTPVRPPLDPAGRVAIVVDDGLATGETMLAALHAVRAHAAEAADLRRSRRVGRGGGESATARGRDGLPADARLLLRGRPVLSRLPAGRRRRSHRAPARCRSTYGASGLTMSPAASVRRRGGSGGASQRRNQ